MFSINGIGQGIYQNYQTRRSGDSDVSAQPVTPSDPDGDNPSTTIAFPPGMLDLFGSALSATLAEYQIDPQEFRRNFLSALHRISHGLQPETALGEPVHVNTLG